MGHIRDRGGRTTCTIPLAAAAIALATAAIALATAIAATLNEKKERRKETPAA